MPEKDIKFTHPTPLFFACSDPPGTPEIGGYIEGETIRLGQTVNLVCSSHGGNPLPDVVWYKDGRIVDSSYTTSGRESRNLYSFAAATDDNNARYRCEARNRLSPYPLSADTVLSVQCECRTPMPCLPDQYRWREFSDGLIVLTPGQALEQSGKKRTLTTTKFRPPPSLVSSPAGVPLVNPQYWLGNCRYK